MAQKHPHEEIANLRAQEFGWDEVINILDLDVSPETLRGAHSRWRKNNPAMTASIEQGVEFKEEMGRAEGTAYHAATGNDAGRGPSDPTSSDEPTALLTRDDISRIASLEDLLTFFQVDTDRWEPARFKVNKWETAAKNRKTEQMMITPLYQVKASLERKVEDRIQLLEEAAARTIEDMRNHAPVYEPVKRRELLSGDAIMSTVAIQDAHFGMKAFGAELTGVDYDLKIAERDYAAAAEHLLSFARLYNTERILLVVGNDMIHVDAPGADGRVGGVTTKGTPQDTDTRLGKMFSAARRACVAAADMARLIAPVTIMVVPGNHARHSEYKLAEVLSAWYRLDPEVEVVYASSDKRFLAYGKNTVMLTHGEEVMRKRDNLPQIFADECPAELWVSSDHRIGGYREILTGHLHKKLRGGYYPTGDIEESRGIRVRGLSGLTATDGWHHEMGYRHQRAATFLAYRKSGGVAGEHEFTL